MGTETTKVVLDLDNKEFVSKLKDSLGLIGKLGDVGSVAELSEAFIAMGAMAGIAAAAILAVKVAVDFVEEAEEIKQVNMAFEMLAKDAGLAADIIRNDLVHAADGLVDDTELIKAANKALVSMGENAGKIPAIMEIARKATSVFGGDLLGNFEKLNSALAAGNIRMLRQFGIIVDAEKAQKAYAQSIGIGVQYLSEAEKKQALFNAALEQAQSKFKNVNADVTETKNSFQRMQVSLQEIKEAVILVFDKVLGPLVRQAVGGLAKDFHVLAQSVKDYFGDSESGQEKQIKGFKKTREQLEQERDILISMGEDVKNINAQIAALGDAPKEKKKPREETEKQKSDKLKFEQDLLKIAKDRMDAQEQMETNVLEIKKLRAEEIKRIEEETDNKIIELDKRANDLGLAGTQKYAEAKENLLSKMEHDISRVRERAHDDEILALKNLERQNQFVAAGFAASWRRNGAEAASNVKNFAKLGQVSFNAFKSNAVSAFAAIGDGSKTAGEAMKGFIFGALGDIAMAQGTELIAWGIGSMNPVAVAQGGVLVALGSALKSMGQSTGASAPSAGGGGGGGESPGAPGAGAELPKAEASHKKMVSINIHGSYFETDQTRTRLMEMIRESGDFTDFNLNQIGQP